MMSFVGWRWILPVTAISTLALLLICPFLSSGIFKHLEPRPLSLRAAKEGLLELLLRSAAPVRTVVLLLLLLLLSSPLALPDITHAPRHASILSSSRGCSEQVGTKVLVVVDILASVLGLGAHLAGHERQHQVGRSGMRLRRSGDGGLDAGNGSGSGRRIGGLRRGRGRRTGVERADRL